MCRGVYRGLDEDEPGHPATLLTADCFATGKMRSMRAFGADVEVLETPDGQIHPGLIDDWQERLDGDPLAE